MKYKIGDLIKDEGDNALGCITDVLAEIKNDNINFLGWETKDVMKLMPTKVFSSLNIENYYRNREVLRPMAQLDKLLASGIKVDDFGF